MGRGKIEIKMIENSTNRQVTYSKRRGGLLKKAKELSVLCDAQVCLLMVSSTSKFCEYSSPSTTTKAILDRYQQSTGVDIWKEHFDSMKNQLVQLQGANLKLRQEISQRMGEELEELDMNQLRDLEEDLETCLDSIRERKIKQIITQTETYKKKVKSSEDQHRILIRQLTADARFGFSSVESTVSNYDDQITMVNIGDNQPHVYGYGIHELRLA
ncbi:agamous-like MADS-box protein TM6 isoform X2 [Wolffia australiana]